MVSCVYCDLCGDLMPHRDRSYGRNGRTLVRSLYNKKAFRNIYTVTRAYVREIGNEGDVCEECVGRIASEGVISR